MRKTLSGWIAWTGRCGALVLVAVATLVTTVVSAQEVATDTRRPANIQAGTCDDPGDVVFELNDLLVLRPQGDDDDADDDDSGDDDADDWQADQGQFGGAEGASVVERSDDTEIATSLDDLFGAPLIVTVFESDDAQTLIACGEIGGFVFTGDDDDDDDLAVGLREQGGSGFAGVALFDDEDDDREVDVDIFLARDAVGATTSGGS